MSNLFLSVVELSLGTSFVILLLLILRPLSAKFLKLKFRYWAWLILALRLCLPVSLPQAPVVSLQIPDREVVVVTPQEDIAPPVTEQITPPAAEQIAPPIIEVEDTPNVYIRPTETIPEAEIATTKAIPLTQVFGVVWLIGFAIVFLVQIAIYLIFSTRTRRFNRPFEGDVSVLVSEIGIKKKVIVFKNAKIKSPLLIGFFYPVVLIPKNVTNQDDITMILRHELMHLKRADVWYKLLLSFVCAIHWFNPIVWIMSHIANEDLENACDEDVVKNQSESFRQEYCESILNTIRSQKSREPIFTAGFSSKPSELKSRFKRILDTTKKRAGKSVLAVILAAALVGGTFIGCELADGIIQNATAPKFADYWAEKTLSEDEITLQSNRVNYSDIIFDGEFIYAPRFGVGNTTSVVKADRNLNLIKEYDSFHTSSSAVGDCIAVKDGYLYYFYFEPRTGENYDDGTAGTYIVRVPVAGGEKEKVVFSPSMHCKPFIGDKIYYVKKNFLYCCDLDGKNEEQITQTQIAYFAVLDDFVLYDDLNYSNLHAYNLVTKTDEVILDDRNINAPIFDGERIFYIVPANEENYDYTRYELYAVSPSGKDKVKIETGCKIHSYSIKDGYIYFTDAENYSNEQAPNIWRMKYDKKTSETAAPEKIAAQWNVASMQWVGDRLIYEARGFNQYSINICNADGSDNKPFEIKNGDVDEAALQAQLDLDNELWKIIKNPTTTEGIVLTWNGDYKNLNLLDDALTNVTNEKDAVIKGFLNGATSPIAYKFTFENGVAKMSTRLYSNESAVTFNVTDIYEHELFYHFTNGRDLFFSIPKWNYTHAEKTPVAELEQDKKLIDVVLKTHAALSDYNQSIGHQNGDLYGEIVPSEISVTVPSNVTGKIIEAAMINGEKYYKVEVSESGNEYFYYISENGETVFSVSMVAGELIPVSYGNGIVEHIKL